MPPFPPDAARNAPCPRRHPVTDSRHGYSRTDPYAWLRATNWQDVFRDPALLDPEIRAHLEAENAYQEALMADTRELQERLFAEMKGRIKEDDSSVPMRDGPWSYGTLYVAGGQQPKFFRVAEGSDERRILLDGDREAEGKPYFRKFARSPPSALGL